MADEDDIPEAQPADDESGKTPEWIDKLTKAGKWLKKSAASVASKAVDKLEKAAIPTAQAVAQTQTATEREARGIPEAQPATGGLFDSLKGIMKSVVDKIKSPMPSIPDEKPRKPATLSSDPNNAVNSNVAQGPSIGPTVKTQTVTEAQAKGVPSAVDPNSLGQKAKSIVDWLKNLGKSAGGKVAEVAKGVRGLTSETVAATKGGGAEAGAWTAGKGIFAAAASVPFLYQIMKMTGMNLARDAVRSGVPGITDAIGGAANKLGQGSIYLGLASLGASALGMGRVSDVLGGLSGFTGKWAGRLGMVSAIPGVASGIKGALTADTAEGAAKGGLRAIGAGSAALGPWGFPVAILAKFGEKLVEGVEKLRAWNKHLHEGNMQWANFSSKMALVQAESEIRRIRFEQERGEQRGDTAKVQSQEKDRLDRKLSWYEDKLANFQNSISSFLSFETGAAINMWEWFSPLGAQTKAFGTTIDDLTKKLNKWVGNNAAGEGDQTMGEWLMESAESPGGPWEKFGRPDRF